MHCQRCRGYMIRDSFVDLRDDTGRVLFEGGAVSIAAKSSTPWCLRTGWLYRPNHIEGKRGIVARGNV